MINRGLGQLVRRLSHGLSTDDDADECLDGLRACLGVSAALLIESASFAGWNRDSGVSDAWKERYPRYAEQDFCVARARTSDLGTWFLARQDFTEAERDVDVFHAFTALGMSDVALARLYAPSFDDLYLVLYRARGQRPFDDEDRALFELLTPHLAGALASRRALALVDPGAPGGPAPHVWLSFPSGRVIWTQPAREVWRERLGPIGDLGWNRIERALLRAAARFRSASGEGGRSQIVRSDLRLELAYVPPRPDEKQRIVVLFTAEQAPGAPDDAPRTPAEELLSPAQLAVARAAAGGWSVAEIAGARGVSAETVRSHLKAVYGKLGPCTRASLACLVVPAGHPRG